MSYTIGEIIYGIKLPNDLWDDSVEPEDFGLDVIHDGDSDPHYFICIFLGRINETQEVKLKSLVRYLDISDKVKDRWQERIKKLDPVVAAHLKSANLKPEVLIAWTSS